MTLLCFEAHRTDDQVWSIRHQGKWSRHRHVIVGVLMVTHYRGPKAKQPVAYLQTAMPVRVIRGACGIASILPKP